MSCCNTSLVTHCIGSCSSAAHGCYSRVGVAARVCKRPAAGIASLRKQLASQSALQIMDGLPGSCSAGLLQAAWRGVAAALQDHATVSYRCPPSSLYLLSYTCKDRNAIMSKAERSNNDFSSQMSSAHGKRTEGYLL